jgi:tyrosine-specific transport protein
MRQYSQLIGGILLVTGTTIGAGMLALPVSTGMAGFWQSVLLFLFYWAYMTCTAFLMLEVNLWVQPGSNLISMIRLTLGKWGQVAGWLVYLFLLYSLTTAYIAGCGPIIIDALSSLTGKTLPEWIGALPLLAIFGFFVYKGARSVDLVNRLLMVGLVVAYAAMVIFLTPHVDGYLLRHIDWKYMWMGVSVVATSFGFHIIIPSLVTYLNGDERKLKQVIFIGSAIPLFIYILWEFMALGIIPVEGENGIREGYLKGSNGAHLLAAFLSHSAIAMVARFFSFFAIVTSFLGVSLSLFDFLADGLDIKKNRSGRALLYVMTFLPPFIITLLDPRAFLSALEYAGAFGVVILLGLFPALMVWSGRYKKGIASSSTFQVPGGKIALALVILISVAIICLEIVIKSGWAVLPVLG